MKKRAFTLAEMMVVLLILTICLAAFAPLMTKRRTVDISSPWRYASNNSDIYYGMGSTQTAMIGQNSKSADDNARLIINTTDDNHRHVIFKQAGNKVGELWIKGDNFLLGSDYSGSLTGIFNTAIGESSLTSNKSGNYNVALGAATLKTNTTGGSNTAVGTSSLSANISGSANTALGAGALRANNIGRENTASGYEALNSNIAGNNNTAIGNKALYSNTSFSYNTAVGSEALYHSEGAANTAVGHQALHHTTTASYNTATGGYALSSNITGANNTAVGYGALFSAIYGEGNTAVGMDSLYYNKGHFNTAIGQKACINATGSNKTCIGYNSGPTATDGSDTHIVYLGTIGTSAIVSGVNTISVYSDKRLKDVKEEYKKGLEQIRDVVPKLFVYKSDKEKNVRLGVIAQELQKVLPEAVVKNGDGYLIVHQEYIQYALLNAVKQLDKIMQSLITEVKTMVAKLSYHDNKIKKLEQECADLKQENNAMKQENAELKARLEKLEKFVF